MQRIKVENSNRTQFCLYAMAVTEKDGSTPIDNAIYVSGKPISKLRAELSEGTYTRIGDTPYNNDDVDFNIKADIVPVITGIGSDDNSNIFNSFELEFAKPFSNAPIQSIVTGDQQQANSIYFKLQPGLINQFAGICVDFKTQDYLDESGNIIKGDDRVLILSIGIFDIEKKDGRFEFTTQFDTMKDFISRTIVQNAEDEKNKKNQLEY